MILTIGFPSADLVNVDMALCLNSACIYTLQQNVKINAIVNKKGSIVHQARCDLAKEAMANGATHLLMVDSDHVFPKDMIVRLVKAEKDIIGIHQVTKRPPVRSNCEGLDKKRLTAPGVGVEEVHRLGTGIMLIKTDVFRRMSMPYFNFWWEKDKGWTGEDYWFCKHAKEKGFKIFVDHDLSRECYHIGPASYGVTELERNEP
jgi:hypothetical protein